MRRLLVPIALVVASVLLFPSGPGLFERWKKLPALDASSAKGSDNHALDSLRQAWNRTSAPDTGVRTGKIADPFRLAVASDDADPKPRQPAGFGPPPPRLWKATGRVGERAAVLSHPDGRVVVVAIGQAIDSASVVGIGPGGVELEDRGGRFTLRIP